MIYPSKLALVQQQQITDVNLHQKDQDHRTNDVVVPGEVPCQSPNCCVKFDQSRPVTDTVVALPNVNGSIGDTSTQCSDLDEDADDSEKDNAEEENEEDTDLEEGEWSIDLPAPAVIQHHQQVLTQNGNVVLPNADPTAFGDVCVKNSSNVHLGNKTFYKGPVTIKQFVYTNPTSVQEQEAANYNPGRISDGNTSDLLATKVDVGLNRPILRSSPNYDKDNDKLNDDEERQDEEKIVNRVKQWLWTWRCAALLCTIALILITIIVVASVLITHRYVVPPTAVFPDIPDSSIEGVVVSNVRFVERNEWGAQPPTEPLTKMKLPVRYVIISHTVTDFCTTQSECTFHVRFAQTFHIESRKWSDIAYNFLVGGDGLAYVGRSWNYMGAHSFGYNNISIGISFIGTFNSVIPPKAQLHAAQRIIEVGVEAGKIAKDYILLGHRQISKTLSPGDALYSIIKTWPHWSPRP